MSVPDDVQQFLRERVETFEQLESLLLLSSQRDRKWTVEAIALATKMRRTAVATALDELCNLGLIEASEDAGGTSYQVSQASSESDVAETLERLRHAYEERPVEVMKLMSNNAMERLRTAAIRTFSEAFVLRRKKDG